MKYISGLPSFLWPRFPLTLHLITPDTSVNFYWFLYWLMWIFGNFFFLLSSDLCVTRLLVSLQSSSFFPLSSSTAHILFIVNLMRQLSSWSKIYRTAMLHIPPKEKGKVHLQFLLVLHAQLILYFLFCLQWKILK